MDIEAAVRAYILADPALADAIGDRLWPVKLPQNPTLPAITAQRISGVRFGVLRGPAGLARPRIQFDVWAREGRESDDGGVRGAAKECRRIGGLLLERLEGKTVLLDDTSVSPPVPRRVGFEFIDDADTFEPDVSGGLYRHQADYFVMHHTGR